MKPNPRIVGLAVLLALAAALAIAYRSSPVLPGTVIKVTDGDGINVQLQNGPMEVRVFGADAPERSQSFYLAATKLMRSLVEDERVDLKQVKRNDRHGRMVARVFVGDTDIGAAMIEKGYAWAYRDYLWQVPGAERYCDLEAQARADRRGLWADLPAKWEPPWVVRARADGRYAPPHDYSGETAADCRTSIRREAKPVPKDVPRDVPPPDRPGCLIKGNINSKGERIYHVPGSSSYDDTRIDPSRGERWFCTEEEARAAGWRAPRG